MSSVTPPGRKSIPRGGGVAPGDELEGGTAGELDFVRGGEVALQLVVDVGEAGGDGPGGLGGEGAAGAEEGVGEEEVPRGVGGGSPCDGEGEEGEEAERGKGVHFHGDEGW